MMSYRMRLSGKSRTAGATTNAPSRTITGATNAQPSHVSPARTTGLGSREQRVDLPGRRLQGRQRGSFVRDDVLLGALDQLQDLEVLRRRRGRARERELLDRHRVVRVRLQEGLELGIVERLLHDRNIAGGPA